MRKFPKNYRAVVVFAVMSLLAIGLISGFGGVPESATAQTKNEAKAAASIAVVPPPADVNDLSMEVAALRTLYLLKAGPENANENNTYEVLKIEAKGCAQAPKQRRAAEVGPKYKKVLIELRAAFIANQVDRINELSEQLEELNDDEQPDLDDAVEITDLARKQGPRVLRGYFDARRIAGYITAYGKDFPDPHYLMITTVKGLRKGEKPTPEEWKQTSDFVINEVALAFGGISGKHDMVAEKVGKILEKAYPLTKKQIDEEFKYKGKGLRGEIAGLKHQFTQGPLDVIKHVVERDFAELFSNPRLMSAIAAREDYLKKSGWVESTSTKSLP